MFSSDGKKKKTVIISLVSGSILLFLFRSQLFELVPKLTYFQTVIVDEIRGFNLGILVKPIYAVFQFVFGYDIEMTENIFVSLLFLLILLTFIYRLLKMRQENRQQFYLTIFAGVAPFVLMYWLLEPLTPLGATQFESKHALFFLPFFLSAFVPGSQRKATIVKYFPPALIILSVSVGLFTSLSAERIDWPHIVHMARDVQRKGGVVVVDGRSEETFLFYGKDQVDPQYLYSIYDIERVRSAVKSSPFVMVVTDDWKSYQILTKYQNWNSGAGTSERFHAVSRLFGLLRQNDEDCIDSYIHYPLFSYIYRNGGSASELHQPRPAFFQIPYKDIYLPITKESTKVYGWEDITAENSFDIGVDKSQHISIFYFVEDASMLKDGTRIGKLDFGTSVIPLLIGRHHRDKYQNAYSRGLYQSDIWYTWEKRPVFTYSLKYPGSLFSSEGHIYKSDFTIPGKGKIVIENPNVVLHLCAIRINK